MDGLSDEALLTGMASGNAEAAAAFVRRFQGRVYGLALTVLRDPGQADEVAQETFVRAWRHAATYDVRRGRVATWLLTIARNLAIDHARLRTATPVDPDVIASELDVLHEDPRPDLGERERVRRAVGALPADQRRALVLAMYAGRTAREISELDGVALGTVKTRIRAAMLKLRATLGVELSCEQTRELAVELALGIADGAERAQALRHLAECPECRRAVEELSEVTDELLLLAPEHQPPAGFESRVLAQLTPARARRLRRFLAPLAAAAAAVAAAAVVWQATSDDRGLAAHYRDTLAVAHGSSFEAARLRAPGGVRAGVVYGYRGAPSWIFVAIYRPYRSTAYTVELATTSGRRVSLPSLRLDPRTGSAGQAIPVDLEHVSAVRLVGSMRGDVLEADLPRAR